jgi:nitrite reductase/ring-hydroxylating ferredoxin subunit
VEVLDALLMAFPALGLAKIIWAVDIILEMNIPGFQPEILISPSTETAAEPGQWHDVMAGTDVRNGEVMRTECDGRGLFIYRNKKTYQVFDSRCPHQSTDIPELALKGSTLTCPKHHWVFDAKSGDCIKKGNSPLKRIESKVVKGHLLAYW